MPSNFVCGTSLCTACGACADSCPFDALVMRETADGPIPMVIADRCKSCGRCHSVCPTLNLINLRKPLKTYAAWSCNQDDIERSSSGGMASALSRMIIEQGGVVFGSTSCEGEARCIAVMDDAGLERLRGSKYVYSSPNGSFKKVRELLAKRQTVFFVSTPCQVAALRSFLGGKEEGLLCADLICHGTPSMSFLKEHLDFAVQKTWDSFSFRGLRDFRLCAYEGGRLVYDKPCFEDEYFSAFEAGIIHRNVCYECPYARNERSGDLTLGDFWGLDKESLHSTPPGKVSLVLANTRKGINALETLPASVVLEEREFCEADNEKQTNLHSPSPQTKDRFRFIAAYEKSGFNAAVRKTFAWRRFRLRVVKHKLISIFRK